MTMDGVKRVLLVENEVLVRKLMARILTRWGFEVLEQATPEAALQHVRSAPPGGVADVLVTDAAMPGMTGPELAAGIAEFWPGLGVLYVTSDAGGDLIGRGLVGSKSILQKPFTPQELIKQVGRLLEDRVSGELDAAPTVDGA